jgi:hypothetical protein
MVSTSYISGSFESELLMQMQILAVALSYQNRDTHGLAPGLARIHQQSSTRRADCSNVCFLPFA